VYDVCDHQFLNDVLPVPVTTAENIAAWIAVEMIEGLDGMRVAVEFVRVWETATSYAEVRPE
jgi:6-pyruvoyl-tetrahydropterin synthase